VAQLASALEIDLVQESGNHARSTRPGYPRTMRPAMRAYLVSTLNASDDASAAPPTAVVAFLTEHEAALAAVRAQLNANAPPRWLSDVQEITDPPRPAIAGNGDLAYLFAIDTLDRHRRGDDVTAWQDLDAIWKLGRGLLAEPDPWCESNGLFAAQIVAGIAAKLQPPLPLWWPAFLAFDFDRASAASMQYQAWRTLLFTQRYPAGEPDDDDGAVKQMARRGAEVIMGPFHLQRAERSASSMRARAARFERMSPCASFPADQYAVWDTLWVRARRFDVEREGVARLLTLKEARLATGAWPASLPGIERSRCAAHTWRYARMEDGSMRLTFAPPVPLPVSRDSRLILPMDFVRR
jgi:hypothetical protein